VVFGVMEVKSKGWAKFMNSCNEGECLCWGDDYVAVIHVGREYCFREFCVELA
jgi:hypothetical protein